MGRRKTARALSVGIPAHWIIGPDSHTNALHRVRASFNIRHAWLALTTAWLAACSSTLHGAGSSPGVPQQPLPQSSVTRAPPEAAPSVATAPAPLPYTAADGSAPSPGGGLPPEYPPPGANAPPPAATPSDEARDRQFEILNEAVAALRQEVSRSYARAEELGAENRRLRALVASLRQDLRKSRSANKALDDHLRTLEKRLSEISSPPQENPTPETGGATAPEEKPAPTPPSPPTPEVHQPQPQPEEPRVDDGNQGSAAPPEDDAD
jgi:hypothetical protein